VGSLHMAGEVASGDPPETELAVHPRLLGTQHSEADEIKLGLLSVVLAVDMLPPVPVLAATWHSKPGQVSSHAMKIYYYRVTYLSLECTTPGL
jgi:hypothetical protein